MHTRDTRFLRVSSSHCRVKDNEGRSRWFADFPPKNEIQDVSRVMIADVIVGHSYADAEMRSCFSGF